MTSPDNLLRRFVGVVIRREWDSFTQSYVSRGWIAKRQALVDAEFERWKRGERNGGTCTMCGRPTDDHPMPERLWRSSPELCRQAMQRPPS